jgi:hypothetical protein
MAYRRWVWFTGWFKLDEYESLKRLIAAFILIPFFTVSFGQANNLLENEKEKGDEIVTEEITITPQNYYKYRADGKPGRGIVVNFNNKKFMQELLFLLKIL